LYDEPFFMNLITFDTDKREYLRMIQTSIFPFLLWVDKIQWKLMCNSQPM